MQHTVTNFESRTQCVGRLTPPGLTLHGPCRWLLQVRAGLGFRPLVIVVVGLIYSRYRAAKLSSTDLREDDAVAAGVGGGGRSGGHGVSRVGSGGASPHS